MTTSQDILAGHDRREQPAPLPPMGMRARLRRRYLDVLASIYIYNEHRGYTALDRVIEAVRAVCPENDAFIAAIGQHRVDEEKHYRMFRRWFERQGRMPLALDRGYGHIDHFVTLVFGVPIDALDTGGVAGDAAAFERLCRVIALTEQRGIRQVEILLKSPVVMADPLLKRIFTIIHKDEPGHFVPYLDWLAQRNRPDGLWQERVADWLIHKKLMLWKLPLLFLNLRAPRLTQWPDARDAQAGGISPWRTGSDRSLRG